ncbi:MAG TPA: FHA domain-containing protein [Bryobacteraceae bacterium]|nr:FHA domain-containing protein [Bryobacteraceae bacterium]
MSLSDLIEKLGKTIFEAPFDRALAPKDIPELAEIRLAVLEEIVNKGQRARGKMLFPYNLVRIHVRGAGDQESAFLKSDFLKSYFEQEIRSGLARLNYRFPEDLEVEFETTPELPNGGKWLRVETGSRPKKEPLPLVNRHSARLVVVRGKATAEEISLEKDRTNIGRTVEVYRAQGPSRRNDLAFAEEDEINRTVSREHAHIVYTKKTGEYRLFNDRWYKQDKREPANCGLWIIRGGLSREVARNARGIKLEAGDEIQLGRAIVRFELA